MMIHPAGWLFFGALTSSLFITASASSWFVAWLGLELNLLSFVPLMLKKNSVEPSLKYFLAQALASIMIISAISLAPSSMVSLMVICLALLLKSGAAPSHQWLPGIVEGLSWPLIAVLLTIQKMNPLIIIFFVLKAPGLAAVLPVYIVSSAFVGSIGGLNQTSLRKIMAYSAISHMSWLLAALLCNSWIWLVYFTAYTLVLVCLVSLLSHSQLMSLNNLTTMNKSYLSFMTSLSIMSLGGLPPFTGFVPKFMLLPYLASSPWSVLLVPLLASTFISLFFYARLLMASLVLSGVSHSSGISPNKMDLSLAFINLAGLVLPPFAVLLT
uniref:NADH dehydrogenase subunit 2 n=1 Tax=Macrohectopus branickii TaxID=65455 RepID=UPI001D10E747|nr:NADH dehydrogenase subunit 2 [Macrohectopus branickii]UCL27462.1 NADH dehydrogenase subunit 2 [Macrohectopus branickii]